MDNVGTLVLAKFCEQSVTCLGLTLYYSETKPAEFNPITVQLNSHVSIKM